MLKVDIDITGDDKAREALAQLDRRVRRKAVDQVLMPVARRLRSEIRQAAPVGETGNLRKSMRIARRSYRGGTSRHLYIGPLYPDGAHGGLVEHGSGPRYTTAGLYRGEMPAQPFVAPTFQSMESDLQSDIAAGLASLVEEGTT